MWPGGSVSPGLRLNIMKIPSLLLLAAALFSSVAFAENATEADQKWLAAVQKMVASGKDTVSTASETRVALARDWAKEKGLVAEVAKTEQGFKLTFSKSLAAN